MVKVVLISDTHNRHKELIVPNGDILIHAGDFSLNGTLLENKSFFNWFENLPHPNKLFISGNHDWMGQNNPLQFKNLLTEHPEIIYLEDSGAKILGLKIWGSPWQPTFYNWAYNLSRGEKIRKKWDLIPEDTDILITHGPPANILDLVPYDKVHVGCEDLSIKIKQLPNLKLHVFGHIHFMGGKKVKEGNITFVNAAVVNESYVVSNKPIVMDIKL